MSALVLKALRTCEYADEGACPDCEGSRWNGGHDRACGVAQAIAEMDPAFAFEAIDLAQEEAIKQERYRNRKPGEGAGMFDMDATSRLLRDLYSDQRVDDIMAGRITGLGGWLPK